MKMQNENEEKSGRDVILRRLCKKHLCRFSDKKIRPEGLIDRNSVTLHQRLGHLHQSD